MKRFVLLVLLAANTAFADSKTIGPDGIDSKITGLDGSYNDGLTGVNIGDADRLRSGKAGYDLPENSAANTIPYGVYYQTTTSMAAPNDAIGDNGHATEVAGVMIGKPIPDDTYEGVAPAARLHSIGIGDWNDQSLDGVVLQRLATLNVVGEIKAINISFAAPLTFFENDGESLLSQFIDWSARQHNVLYVCRAARDFEQTWVVKPADNYNGLTIGSSDLDEDGNYFSTFGGSNYPPEFTAFERTHIDLLAPGEDVQIYGPGTTQQIRQGTSYSAPHVTGTVALLEQYTDQQVRAGNERFFLDIPHEAYKAILLNSADKLAGVQGSNRDVTNHLGQKWTETLAYSSSEIPLDSGMGAGHLNVRRAILSWFSVKRNFRFGALAN